MHNFRIRKNSSRRRLLVFADGSFQRTIGQMKTYWTFSSGQRIPITFEVLENCCADVVIGESILYDHHVS